MMTSIPYRLDPDVYVSQIVARGGSLAGLLEAWRKGSLDWEPDYMTDVVIAWSKILPD